MTPFAPATRIPYHMAQVRPSLTPAAALPPAPDTLFMGYEGAPGFVETLLVLTATSAGAWIGISTGLSRRTGNYARAAGWIGGLGAALIGLLYLGTKTGVGEKIGLPAVRISPV